MPAAVGVERRFIAHHFDHEALRALTNVPSK